ncbi:hypothetical protein OH76DRAFT_1424072 [Lentinus brumalis]|uniref:Uncharacterized protein n=1 Tax=Lentinus brumalis TaxID=2498619 RepID=A0A371CHR3_9APHY|nr:hypothetical protein OH76DRAFT_1424072 [Polyporus brumalis]
MSYSNNFPGATTTHPDGSNNPGMGGGAWGNPTPQQQPLTWGTQWGPAPSNPGDGPRGGGGYTAVPPPSFSQSAPPYASPATTASAPPANPTATDDAWRVALQTARELTEVFRARTVDLTNRNTQLEAEIKEFRRREAAVAARELEVTRREADLRANPAPRFPYRGGRPFSSSRGGGTMHRSPTTWSAPQSQPSTPSTTTASEPPPSVASTTATDPIAENDRAPPVVPRKRERDPDDEGHDDDVVFSVGDNAVGIARKKEHRSPRASAEAGEGPEINDPTKSSEYVFAGKPDPSVEGHPHSKWYIWFRSANQGDLIDAALDDLPYDDESGPVPYDLPDWVLEDMGDEAEEKEKRRVSRQRGKGSRPPAPNPRQDGDCGPWEAIEIVTAHQAHNLRHLAVREKDQNAARYYRRLIVRTQDPTRYRTEGIRYLMKSWVHDIGHLPPANAIAPTIDNDAPSQETPSSTEDPLPIPAVRIIPVDSDPAQSWLARSRSGRNRGLYALHNVNDAVAYFADIDTSEWPIGMRMSTNALPHSTVTRSMPNAADVVAETFLSAILPVIPDGEEERFGESAFFRGAIELLSIEPALAWISSVGQYHHMLLEEPVPYPHDCRELRYDHIAAWISSHAATSLGDLHSALHAYARNTRARLEGLPIGVTTFRTIPRSIADIRHESYAARIPRDDMVLALPVKSYAAVPDVVMGEAHAVDENAGPVASSAPAADV